MTQVTPRQFYAVSFTCTMALLLHWGTIPFWVLIAAIAIAVGGTLQTTYFNKPIAAWIRLPFILILIGLVSLSVGWPLSRDGGSASLAILVAAKLMEIKQRRDALLIVMLSLFLAVVAFLFEQGALQTALTCLVVLMVLATLNELLPGQLPLAKSLPPWRKSSLRLAVIYLLLAAPFALACFVFFPRLASPLWGKPSDGFSGRTGISGEMRPGMLSALAQDESPAFRVAFEGDIPAPRERYWRGPVLWDVRNGVWSDAWSVMAQRNPAKQNQLELTSTPINYQISMEPNQQRWLFYLGAPIKVPSDANIRNDLQVLTETRITQPREVSASSVLTYRLDNQLDSIWRQRALRLDGEENPRTRELALSLRADHPTDADLINAVLALYNGEFTYSIEPPPWGRNGIDEFLFDIKIGFCEHYAASFTYLMRGAGIPARIVTGYQGGYYNNAGKYLLVSQSDAHAWTEVWLKDRGWVRVDPTAAVAPARIERGSLVAAIPGAAEWYEGGWSESWREQLDGIRYWWTRTVVQFNASTQQALLKDWGLAQLNWKALTLIFVGISISGLLIAVFVLGWRGRSKTDPMLGAYRKLCIRLAKLGNQRFAHEGPQTYLNRIKQESGNANADLSRLFDDFIALRYGPKQASARLRTEWIARANKFRLARKQR